MNYKKHPKYDSKSMTEDYIKEVAGKFGYFDDRENARSEVLSLKEIAEQFLITPLKARKILITAGAYSTATSRKVQELYEQGKSIEEIERILQLSRASVHSYLSYRKLIYNMLELSTTAEKQILYRKRKTALKELSENPCEENLWNAIIAFQNYPFITFGRGKGPGVKFLYYIKTLKDGSLGKELVVNRKQKTITQSSIFMAYKNVLKYDGKITDPKQMEVFGASYIYPIFVRFGLIVGNKNLA